MDPTRRKLLQAAVLGAGGLGLRALAAGLPAGLLAAPRRAAAAEACNAANLAGTSEPQRLILVTSAGGDPLNANVPGCYVDGIYHPPDFALASPWQGLATTAPGLLDRTCFFHHATFTSAHGDHGKVNTLMGAIRRQEMLVSLLAKNLSGCGPVTTQAAPVVLSDVLVRYQGAVLPVLSRSALQRVLTVPEAGTPADLLRTRRDADLDAMNALFRSSGTPAQQAAIDRYVAAQAAARAVPSDLVASLADTADDAATSDTPDPASGTYSRGSLDRRRLNTAAVVLFRMHVTPVVAMNWDFGGDNHSDGDLGNEQSAHRESLEALADLWRKLGAHDGMRDTVTIAFMNVFGRTLNAANRGGNTNGRDHNAGHHCTVLIGKGLKGCTVGGVIPAGNDFRAQAIASATGAADPNGDIPYEQTLASVGKTLGAAVGVSRSVLDDQITTGKYVEAALA